MSRHANYRLGLGLAVLTVLFLIFGIGALGIIGAGGPDDRMYAAAPAVLLLGAALARLQAGGMALALVTTAGVTLLVGVIAVARGLHDRPGASVVEILGISGMYAALFALSGWFFRRAAAPGSTPLLTRSA